MLHTYKFNNSNKTLVLFHGTGGDENALISLAQEVAPNFNHLALRGEVTGDDGMRRFAYTTKENPIIDSEDMLRRVPNIIKILKMLKVRYGIQELWALGFSNGANALSAILLDGEPIFNRAILLRPSNIDITTKENNLNGLNILIHSGAKDDILDPQDAKDLELRLINNGGNVEHKVLPYDHWMRQAEVDILKQWFKDNS